MNDDRHTITIAMSVASILAMCKHAHFFPRAIHWQLNAYTNWNLSLLLIRYLFSIHEWDAFLCVNSVGILVGFRTAFVQGLDDNIRQKLSDLNFSLTRKQFVIGDLMVHTLPAIMTIYSMVRQKRKVPPVAVTYAITLASWFAFRQSGTLDASKIYVPHPWKRSWIAAAVAMMITPRLVNSLQKHKYSHSLFYIFPVILCYASTRLDTNLRKKYHFEFLLEKQGKKKGGNFQRSQSFSH